MDERSDAVAARTLEVASEYQRLLGAGQLDEWIELWHPEGTLTFPFAPPSRPRSYEGRHAILEYMRGAAGRVRTDRVESMRLHPAQDPCTLVVELETCGHLVDTGAPYDQRYVCIFELRDGLLWRYREYWNPLVSAAAYGGIDAWLSASTPDR